MLNQCEWGCERLRTHSARVVPLVRRLGRSLVHVIRHHIESGTEWGGDVSEFGSTASLLTVCSSGQGNAGRHCCHLLPRALSLTGTVSQEQLCCSRTNCSSGSTSTMSLSKAFK